MSKLSLLANVKETERLRMRSVNKLGSSGLSLPVPNCVAQKAVSPFSSVILTSVVLPGSIWTTLELLTVRSLIR